VPLYGQEKSKKEGSKKKEDHKEKEIIAIEF